MNRQLKYKIANMIGCNYKLNCKILRIKRSWDEVESMLSCRDSCGRPKKHKNHKHPGKKPSCSCK